MSTYYIQDRAWLLKKNMQMKKSSVPEVSTGKEDGLIRDDKCHDQEVRT